VDNGVDVQTHSALKLVTAMAVVVAGCGGSMPPPDRVTPLLASLDKAVYADCGQLRDQAARYLVTGQPQSLDPQYLDERTSVLKQPQAVQDAYIRQYVNQLVAGCDGAELARIQLAAYASACISRGGSIAQHEGANGGIFSESGGNLTYPPGWRAGQCVVTYHFNGYSPTYVLPLSADGSVNTREYDNNRDVRCKSHPTSFDSVTGICVRIY
jgi:hypothetical protein